MNYQQEEKGFEVCHLSRSLANPKGFDVEKLRHFLVNIIIIVVVKNNE
jgi:hypothetical protein